MTQAQRTENRRLLARALYRQRLALALALAHERHRAPP
eukprot:COSAG06_NODE_36651_length_444_cov_1.197101_1_plen_37_part_10